MGERSFFSVSYDLIATGGDLKYDLYVNSSSLEDKQKFVKIFPKGENLASSDLIDLKSKYHQLYIPEEQRSSYMRSLAKAKNIKTEDVVTVIKDSAIQYLHKIFDSDKEFSTEVLEETIEGCREAVESMIDVLDDYNIDSLRGLIGSLSGHDFYTYDHSINVSMYSITVLRAIKPNASRDELMHAGLGGLLHDLGKIKISTNILNNPNGLTDQEYKQIQKHPKFGIDLLNANEISVGGGIDLDVIARIVHEHHENWDGTGYPQRLKEKEIHILARVCTVADFFDAITTKRSYSEVLTVEQALEVMEKTSGKKLDPKIFEAFAEHVQYRKIQSTHDLRLSDSFDPTIPYSKLPLLRTKEKEKADFGKIRVVNQGPEEDEK